MVSHPNIRGRRGPGGDTSRVIVFAPDPELAAWVDGELEGARLAIQLARSVAHVVAALVDDPPPRPQILIADLDAMSPAEVLHLHQIRERGWFGIVIAIGKVGDDLKKSLQIARVLRRPLATTNLRDAVNEVGLDRETMQIRKLPSTDRE
ncbi:MAG TPA: hypothetical protein VLX92_04500 [Kofleriaceae bacterium]|nr:hypothetical protein [Kofleriaceae bacterium]